MRGGNKYGPRPATALHAGFDIQTFLVHRNGHEMTTRQGEHLSRKAVARLFDPDGTSGVEENPSGNLKRLLRAARDHHLFRIAMQRPCGSQIARKRFPESLGAHLIAVVKRLSVRNPAPARHQARPDVEWELIDSNLPDAECSPAPQPWRRRFPTG